MDILDKFTDVNGLIKPRSAWVDSGNGVLYTAVWLILYKLARVPIYSTGKFEACIFACLKGGLLLRSPSNTYQEQWDNHLGLAAYAHFYKRPEIARKVLEHAYENDGFFDTDGVKEAKDNLLRFPQIWAIYLIAGFPKLKWLFFPFAWVVSRFMNPPLDDSSGTQLAWLYLYTMNDAFGFGFEKKHAEVLAQFKQNVSVYYEETHPIISMIESL